MESSQKSKIFILLYGKMKYLLKSSDFTYDTSSKKYVLVLAEKLRTNRALTLRNVAFQLRSDMTSPHCLLLCSNLAELSSKTVYSTASSHRFDDVIGLLYESNPGRFVLRQPIKIHIENKDVNRLEFWLRTEDGTLMAAEMGGAIPGEAPAVGIDDVKDIAGLRLFLSHEVNQNSAYETKNTVGDNVRYLINEVSGENYLFSGYQDFQIATWGQHKGVQSDASWNYQIDSTSPNALSTSDYTVVWGCKTCAQTNSAVDKFFNFGFCRVRFKYGLIRVLGHPSNDFVDIPNITLQPARDYIISLKQLADDDGDGVHQYVVVAIDLSDYSEQTGTVDAWSSGGNNPQGTFAWYFSDASQHFLSTSGILGPFMVVEGTNAASETKCINFLKSVYSAGVPQEASGSSSTFVIDVDV